MSSLRMPLLRALGLALIGIFALVPAHAEDVAKRFRVAVGLGLLNGQGKSASASANQLNLVDSFESPVDLYTDPRNDSSVFGSLEFKPGAFASISGQYALSPTFLVELSAGYQRTKLGDIEVQAQFDGVPIPDIERFVFQSYQIEAGEVDLVPIELSGMARFRPRARLNPYVGAGVGYTIVGFDPSDELSALSVAMDASQGSHWQVTSAYFGTETLASTTDEVHDLDGARVDIGDTWTWHGVGGIELSFKRKWVAFLDVRYSFSSRKAKISFDGTGDLGAAVPQVTDYCANGPGNVPPGGTRQTVCPGSSVGEAALRGEYGPMRIEKGGLIDGGRLAPADPTDPTPPDCSNPQQVGECAFVFEPDGVLDSGFYYVQGGEFSYDAFTLQLGVRYTF